MKKILSVIIALFLLFCLIQPTSSAYHTTTYSMSSDHLMLFYDNSGACLTSYSGSDCHIERLTPNTHSSDLHFNHSVQAVGVFGDTVVALCNDTPNDQLEVYTYYPDTDVLDSFAVSGIRYESDRGFFYNSSGIFLVSDRNVNYVEQYSASGTLIKRYPFNSAVTQIGRDYGGHLFVVCAKTLYRFSNGRFSAYSGSSVSVPVMYFDNDLLADSAGVIYRIQNSKCTRLFSADTDFGRITPCIIDNTVYYPCKEKIYGYRLSGGDKIAAFTLDHSILGLYTYRGYVYAICSSGELSVNRIRTDEFTDLTPKNESTQSSNTSGSQVQQNSGGSDPDHVISSSVYQIDFEQYQISGIPSGTTFARLKKNIRHDGYTMRLYYNGKQRKSGSCGTAMKVVFDSDYAKYTFALSVIGDVTGEGNVNSRDLSRLMEHLIGSSQLDDVYSISADLSGDGKVDVKDLAMLHRMI